jgi:putative inorganic carbon (HCO3(-)) transporter
LKCALSEGYECDIGKLDIAFILFVIACALSTATSIIPLDSLRVFAYNLIPLFFVFLFVNAVKTRRDMTVIMHFIIAGVTIASLYGIYQYILHVPVDETLVDVSVSGSISRISGTMGNPNNYAEYLVLCLPFFASSFLNSRNVRSKILIAGLALLPLANLYLTSSRSSWLAFAAACMVYLFLKRRRMLPLIVLAGILLYQFLPPSITNRIATIGRDSSSLYRIPIWEASLRMLKDYWVTGLGTGPEPYMKMFGIYSNMTTVPPHSHMLPLQIWLEFGLAGIASFIWMIVRLFKKGLDGIFRKKDAYYDNISAAAIASLTGIMVIGAFEYVWFYPRVMSMFWIVISIFIAAINASSKIK